MKNFLDDCRQQIFKHHKILQNKKIPRWTPELANDLKFCENGINVLKKNKFLDVLNKNINKLKQFITLTKQYLKVEATHATQGPAPDKEVKKRIELCKGCPGRIESIDEKTDPGGIGFCSLCKCGYSRRAALSVKLTLAGATCPLNKFTPVKGKEKKLKHVKDAVRGVLYSILDRIKI